MNLSKLSSFLLFLTHNCFLKWFPKREKETVMNGLRKQNGEGSIIKVNDNKWVAKISIGTRPDGRVIVKQFSGKTEAIA